MTTEGVSAVTGPPENRALYGVADPREFRRGGVGVVYEATLLAERHGFAAGTRVGLKLLTGVDADRFAKLSVRSALLREHPHPRLARHIESFIGPPLAMEPLDEEDANLFFSVHEWVDGRPLTDHIPDASPAQILDWMGDVAQAVDHLHGLPEGGFAHRDIHARNVIIEPDGRARLIDFDTILWGEATDTVLTSLHALPRLDELSGTPAAQAHDRSMLALVVLRALGRDATATSSMNDLSRRSLESLRASTADSPEVVASLMRAVREPPEHAADVVSGARSRLQGSPKRRGRLGSFGAPWRKGRRESDADREYARLDALISGKSRGRSRARLAFASLTSAVLVAGIASAVVLTDDPSTRDNDDPLAPEQVAFSASNIATSKGSTCAVQATDGKVWCWGKVPSRLDVAAPGNYAGLWETRVPLPVFIGETRRVTAVTEGASHRCASSANGKAWCWGANDRGQLGIGGTEGMWLPSEAVRLTGITSIDAGGDTTCALATGVGVYCWGKPIEHAYNSDGPAQRDTRPEAVAGTRGATAISVGEDTACLIRGGRVYCWGEGGPLGQPGSTARLKTPTEVPGIVDARSVTVGPTTACAVTEAGALYCWGQTHWKPVQAGTGYSRLAERVEAFGAVSDVGIGYAHMCALTVSEEVRCLGSNGEGQLGQGEGPRETSSVKAEGMADVADISVGYDHTCAVKKDRSLWCWGGAGSGQIGDGASAQTQPLPTRVEISTPRDGWTIEPGRYGPLHVGMSASAGLNLGLIRAEDPGVSCGFRWTAAPGLSRKGAFVEFRDFGDPGDLDAIVAGEVGDPGTEPIATPEGIHAGSTLEQLKAAYGSRLDTGRFDGGGAEYTAYVLFGKHGALMFIMDWEARDVVREIAAVRGTNMGDLEPWAAGC